MMEPPAQGPAAKKDLDLVLLQCLIASMQKEQQLPLKYQDLLKNFFKSKLTRLRNNHNDYLKKLTMVKRWIGKTKTNVLLMIF